MYYLCKSCVNPVLILAQIISRETATISATKKNSSDSRGLCPRFNARIKYFGWSHSPRMLEFSSRGGQVPTSILCSCNLFRM